MIERSDTDLPNLGIMSQYLHGYTDRVSAMECASADQAT